MIEIGPLRPGDRAAWEVLARGYKAFYSESEPDEAYERTWQRLATLEATLGDYAGAARAIRRQAEDNPLAFQARPNVGDLLYPLEVPPQRSPTAFGTPPP